METIPRFYLVEHPRPMVVAGESGPAAANSMEILVGRGAGSAHGGRLRAGALRAHAEHKGFGQGQIGAVVALEIELGATPRTVQPGSLPGGEIRPCFGRSLCNLSANETGRDEPIGSSRGAIKRACFPQKQARPRKALLLFHPGNRRNIAQPRL